MSTSAANTPTCRSICSSSSIAATTAGPIAAAPSITHSPFAAAFRRRCRMGPGIVEHAPIENGRIHPRLSFHRRKQVLDYFSRPKVQRGAVTIAGALSHDGCGIRRTSGGRGLAAGYLRSGRVGGVLGLSVAEQRARAEASGKGLRPAFCADDGRPQSSRHLRPQAGCAGEIRGPFKPDCHGDAGTPTL